MKQKKQQAQVDDQVVAYLLSYPKSGNTWLRYIIEYVTGIPTIYERHMGAGIPHLAQLAEGEEPSYLINAKAFEKIKTLTDPHIGYPISSQPRIDWREERMVCNRGLILKRHSAEAIGANEEPVVAHAPTVPALTPETKLLFLIRDPRASAQRASQTGRCPFERASINIEYFVSYQGPKLLVYYEELMKYPEKVILEISSFLGHGQPEQFMKNYDEHFKTSIGAYRTNVGHDYGASSRGDLFNDDDVDDGRLTALNNSLKSIVATSPVIADVLKPYLENGK